MLQRVWRQGEQNRVVENWEVSDPQQGSTAKEHASSKHIAHDASWAERADIYQVQKGKSLEIIRRRILNNVDTHNRAFITTKKKKPWAPETVLFMTAWRGLRPPAFSRRFSNIPISPSPFPS